MAALIQSFTLANPATRATVNQDAKTITLHVPAGTAVTSLAPKIQLAAGCSIAPASDAPQDFSQAVTYTVTDAQSQQTQFTASVDASVPTATEVAAMLGNGINLGNTLDAPNEGEWTNGVKAQEGYFVDYKNAGLQSVRIPITWGAHFGTSAPYTVDPTFLARVEQVAGWGVDRGLTVVINAHHEKWLKADYAGQKARFQALWTQISNHFAAWPPQLVFEILNEPQDKMTAADVNDVNATILPIIRAKNPTRTVIIGAGEMNGLWALINSGFAVPNDTHLIATFHYYTPWNFAGLSQGTWGTANDLASIENDFTAIETWSSTNQIPLYMGEYGAIIRTGGITTDAASRLKWYSEVPKRAKAHHIALAAWEDSGDFGIYHRGTRSWETAILDAISGK